MASQNCHSSVGWNLFLRTLNLYDVVELFLNYRKVQNQLEWIPASAGMTLFLQEKVAMQQYSTRAGNKEAALCKF